MKSKDPIDRAVATLLRRLHSIESCASGMEGYPTTAKRCHNLRNAILTATTNRTEQQPSTDEHLAVRRAVYAVFHPW